MSTVLEAALGRIASPLAGSIFVVSDRVEERLPCRASESFAALGRRLV